MCFNPRLKSVPYYYSFKINRSSVAEQAIMWPVSKQTKCSHSWQQAVGEMSSLAPFSEKQHVIVLEPLIPAVKVYTQQVGSSAIPKIKCPKIFQVL